MFYSPKIRQHANSNNTAFISAKDTLASDDDVEAAADVVSQTVEMVGLLLRVAWHATHITNIRAKAIDKHLCNTISISHE